MVASGASQHSQDYTKTPNKVDRKATGAQCCTECLSKELVPFGRDDGILFRIGGTVMVTRYIYKRTADGTACFCKRPTALDRCTHAACHTEQGGWATA